MVNILSHDMIHSCYKIPHITDYMTPSQIARNKTSPALELRCLFELYFFERINSIECYQQDLHFNVK